jgi:exodeoxyribonuclease V alpha subunit
MNMPQRLHAYREAGVISRDDLAAVTMLVEMAGRDGADEPGFLAWLGMCLAVRTVRDGHTCVDLRRIREWSCGLDLGLPSGLEWPTDVEKWIEQLEAATPLVGRPGDRRPFILAGHGLYLARSLSEEESIAEAIRGRAARGTIRILLGGPGTGKTTKVVEDLISRFSSQRPGERGLRLALAAPTGKAAARMSDVLRGLCLKHKASPDVIKAITAEPARTVHKLLGFNPSRGDRFEYHAGNRLPYDLIIVDEASMLSSTLMHHLLAALRMDAEIQLVGDPDQLASVDAGTVLGDIALFGGAPRKGTPLHDQIEILTKIHRAESAGIIALAAAIRGNAPAKAFAVLEEERDGVTWVDPADRKMLNTVLADTAHHADSLRTAARSGDPATILDIKARLQVLCAHREGPMGVSGWNARIEKRLGIPAADAWYDGRPVMITRNSRALHLSNGDVGVVVPAGPRREAIFGFPEQIIRVPVSRLEHVSTVHALTIHKSQGSEYEHVVVVLPEQPSRIVTRELLYTGVTRARKKVTVIGSREVIEAAIKAPIRRATGLAERLGEGSSA